MKKKRKTTAAGKRSGSRKTAKPAKGRAKPKAARAAVAKARATKTPVRKAAAVAKSASPGDSLDHFINAAASALDLPIDPAWMPAIKTNLEVTLRFAKQVTAFPLPDESEPAPVFVA
jgi:hypothetical protein